jgi:hypothetical protein
MGRNDHKAQDYNIFLPKVLEEEYVKHLKLRILRRVRASQKATKFSDF